MPRKIIHAGACLLALAVAVWGMIAADLWFRGREAYLKGEKYFRWHENPQDKRREIEADYERQKQKLDGLKSKRSMSEEEYKERVELLDFDKNESLAESSIQYAYIWYQTASELFSPPESKWVALARRKMPVAKELWKSELRAKKIPFEDYMLE